MHWVVHDSNFSDVPALLEKLDQSSTPYSLVKVVPFTGDLVDELKLETDRVFCFGSYSMRHAAKRFSWKPGVFEVGDSDFNVQNRYWGELMLNHGSTVMRFGDLGSISGKTFIRPVDDTKFFSGTVFEPATFNEWFPKAVEIYDEIVQISSVKEIWAEYRFWIVDRNIATASRYKIGDRVAYSADVGRDLFGFVQALISPPGNWVPSRAFVLDICETPDGTRIVEINTINSAGLYAADIQRFVAAINDMR